MPTPPHDASAEASILGAILLRNESLLEIDSLTPEDFYDPRHKAVYTAMRELDGKRVAIDTVTLENKLTAKDQLVAIGGVSFLSDLTRVTPTSYNIGHYAAIVKGKARIRRVMLAASEIASKGFSADDASEYLAQAEHAMAIATEVVGPTGPQPIKVAIEGAFKDIWQRCEAGSAVSGVPSGLVDLDALTGGFQPGDLVVVAARPGMGKTALATSILANCSVAHGYPSIMFTLEMPATQLGARLLSAEARIDGTLLRTGQLIRRDLGALTAASDKLLTAPVLFDESLTLSPQEFRARCLRWRNNRELWAGKSMGLVILDYLQLMRAKGLGKNATRQEEISEISRTLKGVAKELGCPVMAMAQLNRDVEKREDKRPMVSDLRESGAIEQDADQILLLYRDEVYTKGECKRPGVAELEVAKHRSGPTGKVELTYLAPYTKFENISRKIVEW